MTSAGGNEPSKSLGVGAEAASQHSFTPRLARVGGAAGATMVEYAIGLILIALAVTMAVRFFGEKVGEKYDCAAARMDDMSGTFLKAGCTANTPTPTPTPTPTLTPSPTPLPTPTPAPVFTCYTCHAAGPGPCPPGTFKNPKYPQYCLEILYQ